MIEQFGRELELVGGQFVRCQAEELAECIANLLRQRGLEETMAWAEPYLPEGLLAGLQERGIRVSMAPSANLPAGLTGALAGAAETATLCLPGGDGRPLSVSLLPQVHIAVLRPEDICLSLEELLNLPEVRQQAASALVTGPSRTGDIELTLTIGVHGPKELIVVCVTEE